MDDEFLKPHSEIGPAGATGPAGKRVKLTIVLDGPDDGSDPHRRRPELVRLVADVSAERADVILASVFRIMAGIG